jgi:hypothetical protein
MKKSSICECCEEKKSETKCQRCLKQICENCVCIIDHLETKWCRFCVDIVGLVKIGHRHPPFAYLKQRKERQNENICRT